MPWPFKKRSLVSSQDRERVLAFQHVLQWCSARQQVAMEEWNSALVSETGSQPGDELSPGPFVALTAENAPRLLPVAERRLAFAQSMESAFSSFESDVKEIQSSETEWSLTLSLAFIEWSNAFSLYGQRCEATVVNLRSLIQGTPAATVNEPGLAVAESESVGRAAWLGQEVMKSCGIRDTEVREIMFAACNELRAKLGKVELSKREYDRLFSRGLAGKRPRFYS